MYQSIFSLFLSIIFISGASAQTIFKNPDDFLVKNDQLPKVLLVGTWHFNYPGMDAHVTSDDLKMNIFSDQKQKELQELLDYIALFKPTKIAVEGGRISGYLIRRFERWKNNTRPLGASEIDQIAIRLMDRFNLDTLYGTDAYPLLSEIRDGRQADSTSRQKQDYIDQIIQDFSWGGADEISNRYSQWYQYKDTMEVKATLLDNFQYMNSDQVLNRGFGAYLNGSFKTEDYIGADGLAMNWMARNLRIYRNIQNIDYDSNDRILVLFGSAHVQLLKFFFECSPEFELVKFNDLKSLK